MACGPVLKARSVRRVAVRFGGLAVWLVLAVMLFSTPRVEAATPDISFSGSGWGHGVGLSQYGAKALAVDGANYEEILHRYFTGVTVGALRATGSDSFIFTDSSPLWVGLLQDQQAVSFDLETGSADLCFDRPGFCVGVATTGDSLRFAPDGLGGCRFEKVGLDGSRVPVGPSGACDGSVRPLSDLTTVSVPFKARSYQRGTLRLRESSVTGAIHLALEIGIDEYMLGFSEVPDSWPMAAIEAQVVVSRSQAVHQLVDIGPETEFDESRRADCHCHFLDRLPSPNYRGLAGEMGHPNWVAAVESTTRKVVTYHGSVTLAQYHSSSGGFTENYADVFGGPGIPYLVTVSDGASISDSAANPHKSWTAGFGQTDLTETFGFSWVSDLKVVERNPSGSARTVSITGIRSGRPPIDLVTAGDVRSALSLRSTAFEVTSFARFADVPTGHLFAGEVLALDALGITSGCTDGYFCPDRSVTRAEMAAFLVRALKLPASSTDVFRDDDGHLLEGDVASLAESGITSGCSATSFCPDRPVTRGEMAAFLIRAIDR